MISATANRLARTLLGALLLLLLSGRAFLQAQTVQITSPASGSNVQLGQTLTVTVAASGAAFQMVGLFCTNPLATPQVLAAPPYQFSIAVPANIPLGTYYLTATGVTTSGGEVDSTRVPINIVGSGTPTLTAQPTILNLRFVGDQAPLQIAGQFPAGPPVDITQSATTTYVSGSTSVATVSPVGMVTATGPGSTYITVNNTLNVPVNVPQPVNVVPAVSRLYAGHTQQFTAQLAISAITGSVNWSPTPSGVGTISSTGLYTAPVPISAQQVVTVTATNAADNTQSASASVILYPYASVNVTPASVSLGQSQTQQFNASVANVSNGNLAVTWSISPTGTGTVDSAGLYTAPASITSTQMVTLTATSVVHSYASGSASITLTPP